MRLRLLTSSVCALGLVGCAPKDPGADGTSGESGGTSGPAASSESGETDATGDETRGTGPEPTGSESGEPPAGDGARPRETAWRTVVDGLPFPADVKTLAVGHLEFNGNFANRGDVAVLFDQDTQVIGVEMRVHDFADELTFLGDDQLAGTADRLGLWAFVGELDKPGNLEAADDCTLAAWKDGCTITAYYDGQTQPARSGVDLRVHLPRAYRGALKVTTEDNLSEPSYPRLGDVVVDGLCGSGVVSLAQGAATVALCAELTPAPTCPAAQIAECEAFTDMGVDAAWSPLCPCSPDLFGQLLVESRAPWAGDITIDMPTTAWVNVHASNEEVDKPHACVPVLENCVGDGCVLDDAGPFTLHAEYNLPSAAAPAGAGYNITARAAGCGPVDFFASPDDWVDADSEPMTAEHGHVRVCTGCL